MAKAIIVAVIIVAIIALVVYLSGKKRIHRLEKNGFEPRTWDERANFRPSPVPQIGYPCGKPRFMPIRLGLQMMGVRRKFDV